MFGFTRVLAAVSLAVALSASASNPVPAPLHPGFDLTTASLDGNAQAAARVLLKRRDCSQWWTCGPFKRDKPRLA
jgi:hypothetical protein